MDTVFSILTLVLCLAVSGCAELLGTDSAQPPQAKAAPPDIKKLAELARSAFQMAKLSGTGEVSPLHATYAPQRGDWIFCIKSSATEQTRYAVFIKDNAILDVRPAVVIDRCSNETYEPMGAP
jgi:hypothetical protein